MQDFITGEQAVRIIEILLQANVANYGSSQDEMVPFDFQDCKKLEALQKEIEGVE